MSLITKGQNTEGVKQLKTPPKRLTNNEIFRSLLKNETVMNLKNALFLTAFFFIVLLSSQCVTTSVENPCLAPPLTFSFVLLDKNDKELITKSNKDSVKIFYLI